ncbi:MAG: IS1634 family transposase [Planctomycetota bacterium]
MLCRVDILLLLCHTVPMYIAVVPNRTSPPAILLREGWREGAKVKKRTIANLSHWPAEKIEALRAVLKGATVGAGPDAFDIVRSRPHGHVVAVLATARRLGIPALLARQPSRMRNIVLALIVSRIIDPGSKLAAARSLGAECGSSSLGTLLDIEQIDEDDIYEAMDWLFPKQQRIEDALARRYLSNGTLVLYDLTSTYFEGRCCPLAALGHNRDGKKGKLQITIGLLCEPEGRPIAVEVFPGNTGDPSTLGSQIEKLRKRFGLERVVLVGDRGMITEARIRKEIAPVAGLAWISALRAPQIQALVEHGSLQLSLFDEKDLGEIHDPRYPGERLIACRNPFLARERSRKREELLAATERELDKIVAATQRPKRALKGAAKIGQRVGKVIGTYKVAKHFEVEITDTSMSYQRKQEQIETEAALDGIYVIRTSVPEEILSADNTVRSYKSLSRIERAFRTMKTVDLKVRPIFHHLEDRVRCHVFLCMLAYYVEWHMRHALAPMLFDEDDPEAAEALRTSIVARAQRSPAAVRKALTKKTADGFPVHSFRTLLADLATVAHSTCRTQVDGAPTFVKITTPTPVQQRAFDLLGVSPER